MTATRSVLAAQATDFPRWYQDVIAKAELAENGPVRGTMVIRPYGYGIWELLQQAMDRRIKAAGAENAYFPLLIPESYLQREAEHVEGFSPELAVVTHAGGKQLEEPAVIRPTSETIIGEYLAKWVQSYRDLPLLLNQWANVVRWELRPRVFLRTTEFLWQEGHTAHATAAEARAYAIKILQEVYREIMVGHLAIPVVVGRKTRRERFAGAVNTMTLEGMTGDGKALQLGTSHELGQNFARAFDIGYLSAEGRREHAWTTSWGTSTRMLGGLIMIHGDDAGLRIPPLAAPTQVVVLAVRDETLEAAHRIATDLRAAGVRVQVDNPDRPALRTPGGRLGAQGRPDPDRGRSARPGVGCRHRRPSASPVRQGPGRAGNPHQHGRRSARRRPSLAPRPGCGPPIRPHHARRHSRGGPRSDGLGDHPVRRGRRGR